MKTAIMVDGAFIVNALPIFGVRKHRMNEWPNFISIAGII